MSASLTEKFAVLKVDESPGSEPPVVLGNKRYSLPARPRRTDTTRKLHFGYWVSPQFIMDVVDKRCKACPDIPRPAEPYMGYVVCMTMDWFKEVYKLKVRIARAVVPPDFQDSDVPEIFGPDGELYILELGGRPRVWQVESLNQLLGRKPQWWEGFWLP